MQTLSSSPLTSSIAPLSKLTAMTLFLLFDSHPLDGFSAAAETLMVLKNMTSNVESDWKDSKLAAVQEDAEICELM
jgi:hypothetical protein